MPRSESITSRYQNHYNIESDCMSERLEENSCDAVSICTAYIKASPFFCEMVMTDEERSAVQDAALALSSRLMRNLSRTVSPDERTVLVCYLFMLSQKYDDAGEDASLWSFLATALGMNEQLIGSNDYNVLCNRLRELVREFCPDKSRYFSDDGQKYYNTLLLHALAPSWSVNHYFNILYDFYSKNLGYQYIEEDNSFEIFVKNIAARWAEESFEDDSKIRLRADSISSSFRMLFSYRPNLMAAVSEALVYRIDELAKGNADSLHSDNRWEMMLKSWYDEKSELERENMRRGKKHALKTGVVRNVRNIRPEYVLDGDSVYIKIPRIRLPEITQNTTLEIYQGGILCGSRKLRTMGTYLLWTTEEYHLPVNAGEEIDCRKPLHIELKIVSSGKTVYSSGNKLKRDYILFRKNGQEIKNITGHSGECWIFTDELSSVEIDDDIGNYYQLGSCGTIMFFTIGSAKSVLWNGTDILEPTAKGLSVRCIFTTKRVEGAAIKSGNTEYIIFTEQPALRILCSDGEIDPDRYRLVMDASRIPLNRIAYNAEEGCYDIAPSGPSFGHHSIQFTDFAAGRTLFDAHYVVFSDFSYEFDKPFYYDESCPCDVAISINGKSTVEHHTLEQGKGRITSKRLPEYALEIDVPLIRVSIGGENGFNMKNWYWYEDIDMSTRVRITGPSCANISFVLGGETIPYDSTCVNYDFGNYIHGGNQHAAKFLPLGLIIRSGRQIIAEKYLTTIHFRPSFSSSPISADGRRIIWNPADRFFGKDSSRFIIRFRNGPSSEYEFRAGSDPSALIADFPGRDGQYRYSISAEGDGLFDVGEPTVLFNGSLLIGNPRRNIFDGKKLALKKGTVISSGRQITCQIGRNEGVIQNIAYYDESFPPDFPLPVINTECSCYSGLLVRGDAPNTCINVYFWILTRYGAVVRRTGGEKILIDTDVSHFHSMAKIVYDCTQEATATLNGCEYFSFDLI